MSKKDLTEQEIRSQYIRPAIVGAGWQDVHIREEYPFTAGRMHITGQKAVRGTRRRVDYLLTYKTIPLALVEAKDNKHSLGAGMQQGLSYAAAHKYVHPYLRYGIILGKRQHYPLPGRLFRHGAQFDFMLSWVDFEPTEEELAALAQVVLDEVRASRKLEEMIFDSRSPNRERYTVLHRPLRLK